MSEAAKPGRLTLDILKQRQALPLQGKIALTQFRLRQWYEYWHGNVYLSYSGGKDSTVLLDIVRGLYPDVPAVFCDTGLEYPEVRKLALKNADVVLRPSMTFKAVIEKYGYPFPTKEQALYIRQYRHTKSEKLKDLRWNGFPPNGRFCISNKWRKLVNAPFEVSEKCCDVMKKAPFKAYENGTGRKPIMATMAAESRLRQQEYIQHGCNAFNAKRQKSTPIGFWTDNDVLAYIVEKNLEYASCYGEIVKDLHGSYTTTGVNRTGCMFCMFGVQLEPEPNRFQKMQESHPKQYTYCMDKLGMRDVLRWLNIPYETTQLRLF